LASPSHGGIFRAFACAPSEICFIPETFERPSKSRAASMTDVTDSSFELPSDVPESPALSYSAPMQFQSQGLPSLAPRPENTSLAPMSVWTLQQAPDSQSGSQRNSESATLHSSPSGIGTASGQQSTATQAYPLGMGSRATQSGAVYELRRVIGKGGCGEVWEAIQGSLGRRVAVKKIRPDFLRQATETGKLLAEIDFRREAAVAARLEHPNIVPIHDFGSDETGAPLLAMKLVRGEPWNKLLEEDFDKLAPADLLAKHLPILVDVAQAVAFAHSQGVVHRDLKPAQVMIGEFGETLLMDWGLAAFFDERKKVGPGGGTTSMIYAELPTLATVTSPAGTPALMAPEQTEPTAAKVGPWTDIYLLGGTLYYLLTKTYPHSATSGRQSMEMAARGEILEPEKRSLDREIPQELSRLCLQALAKRPGDRVDSAKAFVEGLQNYLSGSSNRRESEEFAARAASRLREDEETYRGLSESLQHLGRARALWPHNPRLPNLEEKALGGYTRAALKNSDLKLALFHAEQMAPSPTREELLAQIAAAEARQIAWERQRRWLRRSVGALSVVMIVGSLFFNIRLAAERNQKEQALQEQDKLTQKQKILVHDMGERIKELTCIYGVADLVRHAENQDALFAQVVALLPPAWQYPEVTTARVRFDEREWLSPNFKPSPWRQTSDIMIGGRRRGSIEVFYTQEKPSLAEGPFLAEERALIDRVAHLLGEALERRKLLHDMGERIKELTCIYGIADLADHADKPEALFQNAVALLPPAWQYPEVTTARIRFDEREWLSPNFRESAWRQAADIVINGHRRGAVEVFYTEARPSEAEGPFLVEERALIDRVAKLLGEALERRKLIHDMGERIKELTCIYSMADLADHSDDLDTIFQGAADLLPPAWQYPEVTVGRIRFDDREWKTQNFKESAWRQAADIMVNGRRRGSVEVFYTEKRPSEAEGPFLAEERDLINRIAKLLGESIEREKLIHDMGERIKELTCIYGVADLVDHSDDLEVIFRGAVELLPPAWQYPEATTGRIRFDEKEWTTQNFRESMWRQAADIIVAGRRRGVVEVFYTEQRPIEVEGPFLREERDLINRIAKLLGEAIERKQLLHEKGERMKELGCVYGAVEIIRTANSLDDAFGRAVALLPPAWQYPEATQGRIRFDNREWTTPNFAESVWRQAADIMVAGHRRGAVEVFYAEQKPSEAEGPFLAEERNLINALGTLMSMAAERDPAQRSQMALAGLPSGAKPASAGGSASGQKPSMAPRSPGTTPATGGQAPASSGNRRPGGR
jgi:serine/threonine protein kinase/uncharacterized protein with GYD domain